MPDSFDAYIVLPAGRPLPDVVRTAWLFQRREYAEAALRHACAALQRRAATRRRHPAPVPGYRVAAVRVTDDPASIDSTDFVPLAAVVVRTGFHGARGWRQSRVTSHAATADRLLRLQPDPGASRVVQIALFQS